MKALVFIAAVFFAAACGPRPEGSPPPDEPLADNEFAVRGKYISVTGLVNEGATVTKGEAQSAVKVAVDLLEKQ